MAYEFGTCNADEIEGLSGVCDSASTEQRVFSSPMRD